MSLTERMRTRVNATTARRYLRIDDQAEDAIIEPMIDAAIEDIEGLIGHDFTVIDGDGNLVEYEPPAKLTVAVLRLLGSMYEWREDSTDTERLGDESKTRRTPDEEREALMNYLFQYRKIPRF